MQGGPSGIYLRGQAVLFGEAVRQVKVIGERGEQPEIEEDWLLFSRSMCSPSGGSHMGYVEIAFHLELDASAKIHRVRPILRSPLSVYVSIGTQAGLRLNADAICPDREQRIGRESRSWVVESRLLRAASP